MSIVLVVNSGSSSFKYQLLDMKAERVLASGLVERIGEDTGVATHTVRYYAEPGQPVPAVRDSTHQVERPIPDHSAGFAAMLEAFAQHGPLLDENPPVAVGHRVVHGGARFFEATVITDLVEINIDELSVLAPLHNPGAVQGIRAARRAFASVPHVAVFDTAFHQTLPPAAYTYAIERELAERHRVRRYGFHGTSHAYVSARAPEFLVRDLSDLRQIAFHPGNGPSVTAVPGRSPVDTSLGLTPPQGPVLGHRPGDPGPLRVD